MSWFVLGGIFSIAMLLNVVVTIELRGAIHISAVKRFLYLVILWLVPFLGCYLVHKWLGIGSTSEPFDQTTIGGSRYIPDNHHGFDD